MASTPVSGRLSGGTGLKVPSRASTVFIAAGAVVIGIYYLLPSTAQDAVYLAIGVASVTAVAFAARRMEHGRAAWMLFAGGLLASVIADAISTYYEIHLNKEAPTPSVADGFYLAAYPLLLAGLYLLMRELGAIRTRGAALDALIVTVAVGTVQWIFFFDPTYHSHEGVAASAVDMAYPTMDLLILVALTQLTLNLGWRVVSYELLVWAVVMWVIGDEIFGLSAVNYVAGGWVDVFWLGSYVLWGAAALDPSASRATPRDIRDIPRLTAGRLSIIAAALLTIPTVLLIEHLWPHHNIHAGVLTAGGALLGVLVVVRFADLLHVVDRARISERAANERLRELDRLKDEFVSTVSHELRTPLMSISGYVELARERAEQQERGYLDIVERNAGRLLALVNDLLFVARIRSGGIDLELVDVDLDQIADESVRVAQPLAATAGVALRLEKAANGARVRGDQRRLGQVVDNLVLNAVKFSPPGADVTIVVGCDNGHARIEVTDHGIGVPEDEQEHLFERFFRSSNARSRQIPGTGLGLYISNSIVRAHGGSIGVRSAEHRGSTFIVDLPVAH